MHVVQLSLVMIFFLQVDVLITVKERDSLPSTVFYWEELCLFHPTSELFP